VTPAGGARAVPAGGGSSLPHSGGFGNGISFNNSSCGRKLKVDEGTLLLLAQRNVMRLNLRLPESFAMRQATAGRVSSGSSVSL
jgi:hypothetical protein